MNDDLSLTKESNYGTLDGRSAFVGGHSCTLDLTKPLGLTLPLSQSPQAATLHGTLVGDHYMAPGSYAKIDTRVPKMTQQII